MQCHWAANLKTFKINIMTDKLHQKLFSDLLYSLKYTHAALQGEIRAMDSGFSNFEEAQTHLKKAEKTYNEIFKPKCNCKQGECCNICTSAD